MLPDLAIFHSRSSTVVLVASLGLHECGYLKIIYTFVAITIAEDINEINSVLNTPLILVVTVMISFLLVFVVKIKYVHC